MELEVTMALTYVSILRSAQRLGWRSCWVGPGMSSGLSKICRQNLYADLLRCLPKPGSTLLSTLTLAPKV